MKPLLGLLEVVAERVQVGRLERDAGFEADVGGRVAFREETPAGRFEQLVDLDAGGGFLHRACTPASIAFPAGGTP